MLIRKMLRDIQLNKTQFISIFLMSILGVLIYSGINAEWVGLQTEVEKYYEETHLADYWLVSDHFTKEDVEKVKSLQNVKDSALRLTVDATVILESRPTLRIHMVDENSISSPKIVQGEDFDLEKDGVWLDTAFAKAYDLRVGDYIDVETMGLLIQKEILGLIIHPEYVHNVKDETELMPIPKAFGFAFIPRKALPLANGISANQLLIVVNSDWEGSVGRKQLEDLFSDRYLMIVDREIQPSVGMFQSEIDQNRAMGGVFPVVFFLIAALTMLTTMTRMTTNQRTQMGTLKALGFSRKKILIHYVSYGIWIGFTGGLIGLFLGPLIIPPILFEMQKTMYTLPHWSIVISPASILAVILATLCCGASSYFACNRQLKEEPAATLRPKAPKTGRHSALEKSQLWLKFGFSMQWNLRDIMRSRIRSIMAVIGVLGCTGLLLFGLGLRDSVNDVSSWMFEELHVYNSKINLEEEINTELFTAIDQEYKGQWIQEEGVELLLDEAKESGSLTVLGQGNLLLFENENRQEVHLNSNTVGISFKMAKLLNVHIGDTIKWRIFGDKSWQEVKIDLMYRTPMGQGIVMGEDAYKKTGFEFKPSALLTLEEVTATKLTGIKSIQDINQRRNSFDEMLESMKIIVIILIIAAMILGSVVLYNLGALSFTERIRELATLKVLGFFPKQIRSLLWLQNMWLTILGIILGIPAGIALISFMLGTMSKSSDMMTYISVGSLMISVMGTFALSMVVNLLLSRKVKSIDLVSSLKSVE